MVVVDLAWGYYLSTHHPRYGDQFGYPMMLKNIRMTMMIVAVEVFFFFFPIWAR